MYHLANDFAEGISEVAIFEMEAPDFYMHSFNSPGPDDEEEADDEEGDDSATENDDDPPIDEDIVHSPVPPKTGGRGK